VVSAGAVAAGAVVVGCGVVAGGVGTGAGVAGTAVGDVDGRVGAGRWMASGRDLGNLLSARGTP
jgi:hypothetical protein